MGLEVRKIAPTLSHHKLDLWVQEIPSSLRRDEIQNSSAVVFARALYSLSVEERAMVSCLLALQEIKKLPR